jgi:hypothetical protein
VRTARARHSGGGRAVWALACAAMGLCGCAYLGNPLPPTLDIPTRVTDLRAAEFGDKILVQFTLPPLTTEGLPLTGLKLVEVRAAAGSDGRNYSIPASGPGPVSYQFTAQEWVGKPVTLMVRATGQKGKAADWSNAVALAVATPLTTPARLQAATVPEGVRLTWQGAAPHYRIFRGAGEVPATPFAESDKAEFIDSMADFGAPYKYFVQAIAGEDHQSEASATVSITPLDTFAPAVPAGVTAVAGVNAIELAWERNTEDDFAGYFVYRSSGGGAVARVAGPIDEPTYSDRAVEAGMKYGYAVSAVDKAGNESARSMAVDVTAQ